MWSLTAVKWPRAVFADRKDHNHAFEGWLSGHRPGATIFQPLRVRWVVERTFAWIGRCRRNREDYERTDSSSEAMAQVSSIRLVLRRLNNCAYRRPTNDAPEYLNYECRRM
ncbi:transposase [Fimbriiglobus ruber]|uniref:Mobile element protein n=1 Tax=Fimbriiglobus ruber TaxID=1908690 RepID=A0A225DQR1_9BACT|nr:Mobile element protein [Fimbriiglobus ruber]